MIANEIYGQVGRAVKAIDSKSIGVTRVSSNLTAVGFVLLCYFCCDIFAVIFLFLISSASAVMHRIVLCCT